MYAPQTDVTILKEGSAQFVDVIEKATTFTLDGKKYTREQFERRASE